MIPSKFAQGAWGKSWEEACKTDAVQGTAGLGEEGVTLDIPCGKLLGIPNVVVNGTRESSTADFLYGFSQDGYALVLGNAVYSGGETHYPGMMHQVIRADYLMAAKGCSEFDPSAQIKKMDIELRNLADWYGKSAYCMIYEADDQKNICFKSLEYRRGDDEPCILLNNDQCTVTLFSRYAIPRLNNNEMTFRHRCGLSVDFLASKSLEEALSFAVGLSKFFSLCMGFHASIQTLKFYFDGNGTPIQYYAPFLDSPAPSKNTICSMPFPYRALEAKICIYLNRWFNHCNEMGDEKDYGLIKRAGNMIISVLAYGWKMPVELQCVSVSQALEAISKCKTDLKLWPKMEHKRIQKELMERMKGIPEEYSEWIQSRISQNSKGAKRLMNELMDRQRDVIEWLVPNTDQFVHEQQTARNTYSHGSPAGVVDPPNLYWLTIGAALVGYAILWHLLGMESGEIQAELERSRFKSKAVEWLQQRYCERDVIDISR